MKTKLIFLSVVVVLLIGLIFVINKNRKAREAVRIEENIKHNRELFVSDSLQNLQVMKNHKNSLEVKMQNTSRNKRTKILNETPSTIYSKVNDATSTNNTNENNSVTTNNESINNTRNNENKISECETNDMGDFCFINQFNTTISLNYYKNNGGIPTGYNTTISSGQTSCIYELKSGVYNYSYNHPTLRVHTGYSATYGGDDTQPMKIKGQFKVDKCTSKTLEIK